MFDTLPKDPRLILDWDWSGFEPYFRNLQDRPLDKETINDWLKDWTRIGDVFEELQSRLYVAVSVNTADEQAEKRYNVFFDDVYPRILEAEQGLKKRLIESGFKPEGFEIPLRNMTAQADLYRAENLPILAEEQKVRMEYEKLLGSQTVQWDEQEMTIDQMRLVYQDKDRSRRERSWRMVAGRQLADREAINRLWQQLLGLRRKLAENAGQANYRAYRWQELLRFDYSPADAISFQNAIEAVVVPAAERIYERRRKRLGVETLRPWDLNVDVYGLPPLQPFQSGVELVQGGSRIFHRIDPVLGYYFDQMASEGLLDLENRKNKAIGAYCMYFPAIHRPFIFGNSVGIHEDVQTLLHESGHAFHAFESSGLSYHFRNPPMEFAEVASMAMELLASHYLTADEGGFYSSPDAARARVENLETSICFWPYMAVVDGFQHWVYENSDAASIPAECDTAWSRLWQRFMPGVDWSGLEEVMATGWHRKPHIHTDPFYYIEYGLAQLGAVQVWANSLRDQSGAVAAYRGALALGSTVALPELFRKAGARFSFETRVLQDAVILMEDMILRLEEQIL